MQEVARYCRAIFFFGTPHLGANVAEWGVVLSNIVKAIPGGPKIYKGILDGLGPASEKLQGLTKDFNDFLDTEQRIKICSLQEGRGMTSVSGFGDKVSALPSKSQEMR